MKRILIISEQDFAVVRLTELYNCLFGNEKKALLHCKIDIIDCEQTTTTQTALRTKTKSLVSNVPQSPTTLPLLMSYTKPLKNLVANNCEDINQIIKKHKINVVLIPNFLFDQHRKRQYETIAKEIKKASQVDVLGLYM